MHAMPPNLRNGRRGNHGFFLGARRHADDGLGIGLFRRGFALRVRRFNLGWRGDFNWR